MATTTIRKLYSLGLPFDQWYNPFSKLIAKYGPDDKIALGEVLELSGDINTAISAISVSDASEEDIQSFKSSISAWAIKADKELRAMTPKSGEPSRYLYYALIRATTSGTAKQCVAEVRKIRNWPVAPHGDALISPVDSVLERVFLEVFG